MKQSLLVLMNTMTKKLDLEILMSFHPRNKLCKVLLMVSIAAKNIWPLKINMKNLDNFFSSNFTRESFISY
ncbi:Hypothetical predicted protein [Cloeon dipterum]|uniref:Uncharacterized protein n=1 Tax=Cloeon dipterum TaxID=197152 RepID=A0A8S1E085_9INSE|nr:Hypothetical predicted protein [Cloeon dipterum]